MSDSARITHLAALIVKTGGSSGVKVATAESCTGGLVGAALTDAPGASDVFDCGFITYSNQAKTELLGVDPLLIEKFGAVSGEVARAMAWGAVKRSSAHIAVSITGVAGPGGGGDAKPVGLVWFGLAVSSGGVRIERRVFAGGSRRFVRLKATETALLLLLGALETKS